MPKPGAHTEHTGRHSGVITCDHCWADPRQPGNRGGRLTKPMGQSLGYCRMDSEAAWGPAEGAELGAGIGGLHFTWNICFL